VQLAADARQPTSTLGDQLDVLDRAEPLGCAIEQLQQRFFHRRGNHGPAAETHDRHARRHASAIGKPSDQRRDR
jgi:hypothetical protein